MINLADDNILNAYRFGSHVYGTNTPLSDEDYILIVKEYKESESTDIHYYTEREFQRGLDNHDIRCLECYFLNEKFILKETVKFKLDKVDKSILRKSISTIANGSWVKGEKKLTVSADYDKDLALKSLFHSLRIRDYGLQIATDGKIYDYSRLNYILTDLKIIGTKFQRSELWDRCNEKYGGLYKDLRSQFIALCPKPSNHSQKVDKLTKIFKEYGIYKDVKNTDIMDKIISSLGNK